MWQVLNVSIIFQLDKTRLNEEQYGGKKLVNSLLEHARARHSAQNANSMDALTSYWAVIIESIVVYIFLFSISFFSYSRSIAGCMSEIREGSVIFSDFQKNINSYLNSDINRQI
jgi:hypothetical protein